MDFYEIFNENKDVVIENSKKQYLDKVSCYFIQFNELLSKRRFIKIEEYKKAIEHYKNTYNFINQLKCSNILENYLNYNEKLIIIFNGFLKSYEGIAQEINNHNKIYQNNKKIELNFDLRIAKNILILIKSLDKRYEKSVIINILKGNDLDNIKAEGLDQSKGFGRLNNYNYQDIKKVIDELIKLHYLKYDEPINTISITKKGSIMLNEMK